MILFIFISVVVVLMGGTTPDQISNFIHQIEE